MTTPEAPNLGIPPEPVTQEDLNIWFELQKQLDVVKKQEMDLRKRIFAHFFQHPKEGTNTVPLSAGWVLKGQYKIDRKLDEATFITLAPMLREKGLDVDSLVKYKPELVLPIFRTLTLEQAATFEQVLIIKPGAPSLEIVLPKR